MSGRAQALGGGNTGPALREHHRAHGAGSSLKLGRRQQPHGSSPKIPRGALQGTAHCLGAEEHPAPDRTPRLKRLWPACQWSKGDPNPTPPAPMLPCRDHSRGRTEHRGLRRASSTEQAVPDQQSPLHSWFDFQPCLQVKQIPAPQRPARVLDVTGGRVPFRLHSPYKG